MMCSTCFPVFTVYVHCYLHVLDKDWKAKTQELADFYHDDLPDADNLSVEFHCWQLKWKEHQGEKPSNPRQTLPLPDCIFFPE